MLTIYKRIYYHYFLLSSKKNPDPEIPVYTMLSLVQSNNFLTLLTIFFWITKIDYYDILKLAIICPVSFYVLNYYYFTKKGNGAIIIKDKNYASGRYSFLLDVYSLSSYMLVIFSYYLYKEV